MYLLALAWLYVVVMMALAEASSSQGSVLGALITFVLYGVLPLGLLLYLMGTPHRRAARRRAEAAELVAVQASAQPSAQTDRGDHASSGSPVETLATERKEA